MLFPSPSSPVTGFPFYMASNPENAYLSQAADAGISTSAVRTGEPGSRDVSADISQEYTRLRDRFTRTTTALTSAAHDLKTPLAILNGYIDLLRSGKLGDLNDKQKEVLRDMHSSGQRLEHYIQDFLTFTVLETGDMKMIFTENDMNACLSEVCRLWSNRFQEKGLALYFLGNEKLTPFPFDSAKIQRVISNLLENASKYTPAGGTVWLHAEPYMWERRAPDSQNISTDRRQRNTTVPNAVKVSIADTGPGIPPEYHMEVFDDFFRLPSVESEDGMGLGLAIVRRLVNAMGGKIWVESDPGSGCKFCFLIPLRPPSNSTGQEKSNA
jgi:signal transduction histidine kinase